MKPFQAPRQIQVQPVTHFIDHLSIEEDANGTYRVSLVRIPGRNRAGSFEHEPLAAQERFHAEGLTLSTPMTPTQIADAVIQAHEGRLAAERAVAQEQDRARKALEEANRQREALSRPGSPSL